MSRQGALGGRERRSTHASVCPRDRRTRVRSSLRIGLRPARVPGGIGAERGRRTPEAYGCRDPRPGRRAPRPDEEGPARCAFISLPSTAVASRVVERRGLRPVHAKDCHEWSHRRRQAVRFLILGRTRLPDHWRSVFFTIRALACPPIRFGRSDDRCGSPVPRSGGAGSHVHANAPAGTRRPRRQGFLSPEV